MKEMFIVSYSTGKDDDYYKVDVFVTDKESIAEKWVEKFNKKLNIWKPFYEKRYHDDYISIRYYQVCEINEAFYNKIKAR